jgi:hypothetical protein
MRDEGFGDRFELDLRDALRLELAGGRVGVAAPQVRGRIAARQRARRTTQLLLLAAALAIAALGGLVLAGRIAPPPVGAAPATVAAIDTASGDLVLSRAWPDGRIEETARYAGALDLLQGAIGYTTATALPQDAVATAGPDGRLAIALPDGDVLYLRGPGRGGGPQAGGVAGSFTTGWFGWTPDGRLARVGEAYVRLLDPATGDETAGALPPWVTPDWTRGEVQLLAWSGDGTVVAVREDPAMSEQEVGLLDLTADPPTFVPGLPASIRAATGLELRYAADGRYPGSWCQGGDLAVHCAGVSGHVSQASAPAEAWYVAPPDEALNPDTVRTADGSGLLVVAREMDADRGHVMLVEAPGSWREAFAFDAPAHDTSDMDAYLAGQAYLVGVAPGGRSVALATPTGLVLGDLGSGETTVLPAGAIFAGWPSAPEVVTEVLRAIPACEPPTPEAIAAIRLSDPASASPASAGVRPVVGDRADADPWRVDEMASAEPVVADADGWLLTLALPPGACVEAAKVEALSLADPTSVPGELVTWPIDSGTRAGLLMIVEPESSGEWIIRAELALAGADREAVLLYRVRMVGP